MKVLFVCSGNSKDFDVIPFIKAQGESLRNAGIEIEYYPIKGKGLLGYIRAGLGLRKVYDSDKFDLIHAHFSLSGWAALIGSKNTPLVLSLMGTDAQGDYIGHSKIRFKSRLYTLSTYLIQPFVDAIISKSSNIEEYVYRKRKSYIIPNGIDMNVFKPNTSGFRKELGLKSDKKYVLFLGNKNKPVKNFKLAQDAVESLNLPDVELINPYPLPHSDVPKYLNSVNLLVVPSFMEGSPNVVKEAMACNCPIVATNVGDIQWVIGDTNGCYIANLDTQDFANKILQALSFSEKEGRTNGVQRIHSLSLSSEAIANRLIDVYKSIKPLKADSELVLK